MTVAFLTSKEVIAIDQDRPCNSSFAIRRPRDADGRHLVDGSVTVGIFNYQPGPTPATANLRQLGFSKAGQVRDIWQAKPYSVHGHRLVLLRVSR